MLAVHVRINDLTTGKPTPVRLCVSGPDKTCFAPLGRAPDFPTGRNEEVGGQLRIGRERWHYINGSCEMLLPAGMPLRLRAAKGPEFAPLDETVTLGAGQMALRFTIERRADSNADGWVSIDGRCHFLTPHAALLEAAAEGLDVVNLLATPFPVLARDGNTYPTIPNLLAWSGHTAALEGGGQSVLVNTLNTHPVLGSVALLHSHRPVFPLTFGGEETDDWSVCDWCDQCHRKGGLTVWVDAFEPAGGIQGGEALLAAILGKIDAIEVTGGPRKVPLIPWVYRLWDAGLLIPLLGASGKDSNRTPLGGTRTYARLDGETWVEAVRSGADDRDRRPPSEPGTSRRPLQSRSPGRFNLGARRNCLKRAAGRAGRERGRNDDSWTRLGRGAVLGRRSVRAHLARGSRESARRFRRHRGTDAPCGTDPRLDPDQGAFCQSKAKGRLACVLRCCKRATC